MAIGDFGVSRPLTHAMELVTTMVGTPCYLSPEVQIDGFCRLALFVSFPFFFRKDVKRSW